MAKVKQVHIKANQAHIMDKMAENKIISVKALAEAARMTEAAVSRIVNQRTEPTKKSIFKLSAALKCNPSEIFIFD